MTSPGFQPGAREGGCLCRGSKPAVSRPVHPLPQEEGRHDR